MMVLLGIKGSADSILLPKKHGMGKYFARTEVLINANKWSKILFSAVPGKWVWCLLLRRPLLSIMKAVYEMLHPDKY